MTIDKRMKYEMQGGSKPARNYLGTQKTVSGVPVKWKSGPDAPSTELAYITKAEKDLLLKKNLHGSLKNGPNTGPDGIMSLDSQGDYTRDRSPQGRSRQGQAQHDAQMKSILTGQKNIGQTTKTGPKTRKYAVPEYVNTPSGMKYVGSGYKSYGQPSFFGNLFSRGAPGYRGIKGMPAFRGKPGFDFKQGPEGMGYYSDDENFGDTRDAVPNFGIMGLIQSLANKFKKPPQDMSEFNKLTLGGTHPAALDFNPDAKIQDTAFSKTSKNDFNRMFNVDDIAALINDSSKVPAGDRSYFDLTDDFEGRAWEHFNDIDRYSNSVGPRAVNNYGVEGTTFNNPIGGVDQYAREMEALEKARAGDTVTASELGGTLQDFYTNKQPYTGKMEVWDDNINFNNNNVPSDTEIFNERFVDASTGSPYTSAQDNLLMQHGFKPAEVGNWSNNEGLNLINNLTNWNTRVADGGRIGYANGGLASLFTRRG